MIFSFRTLRMIGVVVAILLLCIAFYCSPLFTVYRLHQALINNDANVFNQQIDFPALRASLTSASSEMGTASAAPNGGAHSHIFTDSGNDIVREQLIDTVVSPTAIEALMKVRALRQSVNVTFANLREQISATIGQPRDPGAVDEKAIAATVDKNEWHHWHLDYSGWSSVRLTYVDPDAAPSGQFQGADTTNRGKAASQDTFADLMAGKIKVVVLRRNLLLDWKVIALN